MALLAALSSLTAAQLPVVGAVCFSCPTSAIDQPVAPVSPSMAVDHNLLEPPSRTIWYEVDGSSVVLAGAVNTV